MFESIGNFFRRMTKVDQKGIESKNAAKERLHLVLMQDRANVSADFLELMKQEIIEVIKKYIVVDESSIDVRLTNKPNEDGTNGAPALYANIPIINIKNDMKADKIKEFEGVNFDKQLEETKKETEKNEKDIETISEMIDGIENSKNIEEEKSDEIKKQEDEKSNNTEQKKLSKKKKKQLKNQKEINEENEEDEDDDVTFDDLLKAAEEEDNKKNNKE